MNEVSDFNTLLTEVLYDDKLNVTTAWVSFELPEGDIVETTGSAKCAAPDVYDPETGTKLALGRAFKNLGQKLVREGYNTVHEHDVERARREHFSAESRRKKREAAYQFQCEFAALINDSKVSVKRNKKRKKEKK